MSGSQSHDKSDEGKTFYCRDNQCLRRTPVCDEQCEDCIRIERSLDNMNQRINDQGRQAPAVTGAEGAKPTATPAATIPHSYKNRCAGCGTMWDADVEQCPSCADAKAVLQRACDRDWKDETLYQTAVIAANAISWRDQEIQNLKPSLDAAAWGGNAHGLTALLEENKRLKEVAERQMNDAEAARLELADALRQRDYYAAKVNGTPIPHEWDRDGERCVKCGAKDWMGGPCSTPSATLTITEEQADAFAQAEVDEFRARMVNLCLGLAAQCEKEARSYETKCPSQASLLSRAVAFKAAAHRIGEKPHRVCYNAHLGSKTNAATDGGTNG